MSEKNKNKTDYNRKKILEALKNTSLSDFDGHTEFSRLTPEEKLLWLSQCAQFVWETRKNRQKF